MVAQGLCDPRKSAQSDHRLAQSISAFCTSCKQDDPPSQPQQAIPSSTICWISAWFGSSIHIRPRLTTHLIILAALEFDAEMSSQSAMEALREHYEGAREISKHVTIARATLTNTNYQNEYTYTFKRFATRMKTTFTVLEKHGEPYAETPKVQMLCDRIQMEGNQRIQIAKLQVMDAHANNFSKAVAYMMRKIAEIFPEVFDMDVRREARRKRNVSEILSKRGRGRRGGGRNRARMGNVNQAHRGRGIVRSFRRQ
jgi:hypothetical protein